MYDMVIRGLDFQSIAAFKCSDHFCDGVCITGRGDDDVVCKIDCQGNAPFLIKIEYKIQLYQ